MLFSLNKKLVILIILFFAFAPNKASSATFNSTLNGNEPIEIDNKDIALKTMNYVISPDKVKLNYEFQNTSDKKTNVVMGYKFPLLTSDYQHENSFRNFEVFINNEKVNIIEYRRALLGGKDITATLKKAGLFIPLDACLRGYDKKFVELSRNLSSKEKAELLSAGIDIENILKGDCYLPWDLEISYNWTVTFDAGAKIAISQNYSPTLTSFSIPLISPKIKKDYCIDDATYAELTKKIGFGKMYPYFFEDSLISAKSWKDTIDSIKISAESKRVGSYVFSCLPNIERKSEFEISSEQLITKPTQDLKVLFLLKN